MIQDKEARNKLGLFDHMFLFRSLLLQPDIQWYFGATNLDMISLEQRFDCPLDG